MKLWWSSRSPFVRKVLVAATEVGVSSWIECVGAELSATQPSAEVMRGNPLSKIPTLELDDGTALYDSPVICEYLDGLHDGPKLFPADPAARIPALRRQALGDGLMDMLVLWRNERGRPEQTQSQPHIAAARVKSQAVFDALEAEAPQLRATPFDIGHLAIGVALSYAAFRFPAEDWPKGRPHLAAWAQGFEERPSARANRLGEGAAA